MKILIYTLSDPISGEIKYVGQTSKTLSERMKTHLSDAKHKKANKRITWINSLLKKDLKPIIDIIDEVVEEDWVFWEMYWIEQLKVWGFNLKNGTIGGDGIKGYVYTEKDKEKMKGRILSKETKEKMSRSKKGKPSPWNSVFGKNHHRFGSKHSEETKDKMRIHIKQFNKLGVLVNEWRGISEASKELKISISGISRACSGERKTAGGYIWKYK